jgi:NADH-ubiquinone oxidoreductase chain 5
MGALTTLFAATSGMLQNDLKRIIAFSTISQLGYIFIAIGLSHYDFALLHITLHSAFKALLFLGAGCVIHGMANQQDVRKLGGLINFLPFVYTVMLIGSLSLMALPWLSGFYSKDLILELAYGTYTIKGYIAWVFGSLTAGITAWYSFRLITLTFLGVPAAPIKSYNNVHEPSLSAIIPLIFLAICSIFLGYMTSEAFVGIGSDFFGNSIFIHPDHVSIVEAEFALPLIIKLAPAILTIVGASAALFLYLLFPNLLFKLTDNNFGRSFYVFFNGKYLLDIILNSYIIRGGMSLGYILSKYLDRGALEYLGPNGLTILNNNLSARLNKLDDGIITNYASYMIISILFINILLFTLFITENTGAFTNVFNETGGLILNSNAGNLFSSSNNIIYAPSLFSNLGPFETYNPSLSLLIGDYITMFNTNNMNYFFSNAFAAIGEYSTHWLVFFISLFFIMILKPKN